MGPEPQVGSQAGVVHPLCIQGGKIAKVPPPPHARNRQRTVNTVSAHSKSWMHNDPAA
ncbi:hypothetical protein [Mycobacterium noviomagense]|uniref:Uncharacterized protein n=1 Tax=Mycobacterium noviomagense TaxID=459858 RepID=A0A7I7PA68_9MYCO|nr:hypothetical protein [Mycobacterium noviomagense]BBY05481.1 hypothetical protein MNVI_07990 [Mycobacterium noviomagense]